VVQTSKGGNDQERSGLDVHANAWARVNASVRNACTASRKRRPLQGGPTKLLKSSKSSRRKAMNGKEDGSTREGPAAVDGEKPLKGGAQGRSDLKYGREGSKPAKRESETHG